MISGAAFCLGIPLFGAAVLYLLRRWERLAGLFAAAIAAEIAAVVWQIPADAPLPFLGLQIAPDAPFSLLGYTWILTRAVHPWLVLIALTTSACLAGAALVPQGRTFSPLALVLLFLGEAALLFAAPLQSPLFLAAAACLAVFTLQAGQIGSIRGAWRSLVIMILAVPLILAATWFIQQAPLDPGDPAPLSTAAILLGIGFAFLLAPVPLHGAVSAVAEDAPPLAAAQWWLLSGAVSLGLLQRTLAAYPWWTSYLDLAQWLTRAGLLTLAWTGLQAAFQRHLGRWWGYAVLVDWGALLLALGLGTGEGLDLAVWLLGIRALVVVLGALSLATLKHRGASLRFEQIRGLASRAPWSTVGLAVAGLSLAGSPLTPAFAGRWALFRATFASDARFPWVLLLASVAVAIGTGRVIRALIGPLRHHLTERESLGTTVAIGFLMTLVALLALFPQLADLPLSAAIATLVAP